MKDYFDKKLSVELRKAAEEITPPDKAEVWTEIEKEIKAFIKRQKAPILKKYISAAIVLILLFASVFLVAGNDLYAESSFFQTVKSVLNNIVNISGSGQTGNEVPVENSPVEINSVREKEFYSLDKAQQLLGYNIVLPKFLPEGYELAGIFVRQENDSMSPVDLHYNDNHGEESLIINENPIVNATAFSYNFRNNDAETRTVNINSSEATLIYFEATGIRKIIWQTTQMYYVIEGGLIEEEIIKIAKSIR